MALEDDLNAQDNDFEKYGWGWRWLLFKCWTQNVLVLDCRVSDRLCLMKRSNVLDLAGQKTSWCGAWVWNLLRESILRSRFNEIRYVCFAFTMKIRCDFANILPYKCCFVAKVPTIPRKSTRPGLFSWAEWRRWRKVIISVLFPNKHPQVVFKL